MHGAILSVQKDPYRPWPLVRPVHERTGRQRIGICLAPRLTDEMDVMKLVQWLTGCVLGAALAGTPVRADDITWLSADFPPLAMPAQGDSQAGYMNMLHMRLVDALPQHRIRDEVLPWPRVLFLTQNGGPYCTAMAARTPERETYLRFTAPYGYVYPVGVVIRAQDQARYKPYLTQAGELQLETVLRSKQLRLGVAGTRSYGGMVDGVLKPWLESGAPHVIQVRQDNSTKSLMDMLYKGRFEFTLAYPGEMVYFGGKDSRLHFYPVAGNSALVAGHFSCTKSTQTDRMFADLVKVTSTLRNDSSLRAAYEEWLPPYLLKPYRQRLARQLATPGE